MKRVVAFFDMFDEIPDNAKYLYSRNVEISLEEGEQKVVRILSNNPDAAPGTSAVVSVHYYEVDGMDFEELMEESEFGRKTSLDKMKEFMQRYKIPMK